MVGPRLGTTRRVAPMRGKRKQKQPPSFSCSLERLPMTVSDLGARVSSDVCEGKDVPCTGYSNTTEPLMVVAPNDTPSDEEKARAC